MALNVYQRGQDRHRVEVPQTGADTAVLRVGQRTGRRTVTHPGRPAPSHRERESCVAELEQPRIRAGAVGELSL